MRSLPASDTVAGSPRVAPVRLRGDVRDVVPATVLESDALLCQLAWLRQSLVLPLARAAAALSARSAWFACGYRNADDFCREGFQRTGRWLRNLVRLHEATQRLPALGAAVAGADGGWPLGQMSALAIARVATEADVGSWIERARTQGLEALRAAVEAVLCERGEASSDRPEEEPYVERRVLLRFDVPPEVALAHEEVRDLHRAVAGRETGVDGFADAVIGEAASSGVVAPEDFRPRFISLAESGPKGHGDSRLRAGLRGRRPGMRADRVRGGSPARRQALRVLVEFEKLQARQERLLHALERATTADFAGRRRIRRLVAVLRRLVSLENPIEIAIGDVSLELHDEHAWPLLGYSGLESYAEERLGLGRSTARGRVSLARQLGYQPLVRGAYISGRIGIEMTRFLLQVLRDRPEADARVWIVAACRTTVKRLRHEERLLHREGLHCRATLAQSMTKGSSQGGGGAGFVRGASARFFPRTKGLPLRQEPVDDATWHASLGRVPGQTREGLLGLGLTLAERVSNEGPMLPVTLKFVIAEDLAVQLRGYVEAARRALSAQPQRTAAEECRLPPSARIANAFVDRGQRVPEWVGYLALLEECTAEWDRRERLPKRDRVGERDGYQCMAPGCTARADLHRHHLQHRSWGGGDEPENQLLLCVFHHQMGEHGGLARCRGRAPLDIEWRLGAEELATWWRNEKRLPRRW